MVRLFIFVLLITSSVLCQAQVRWTFDGVIRNNALAISPDETTAIASNSETPDILVYDLKNEKILKKLPGYVTPRNIIFSQHGEVFYVSDSSQGFIDKIDSKNFKILARYPVGYGAFGTTLSPDGKTMYINNQAASTVTVLDLTEGNPKAVITGFSQPRQGIKTNPDGSKIYVTNFMGDKISIIDTQTNKIEGEIQGFNKIRAISITKDGKTLIAANSGNNTIAVVDLSTSKIINTVEVGKEPYGAALNPEGNTVYSGNLGDNTLSVITLSPLHVNATIKGLEGPRQAIVFKKDGTTAYVLNENLSIAVVDLRENKVVKTLKNI